MLVELDKYVADCRKMIREIEYEFLNENLTDVEEETNFKQVDALIYLIESFQAKIKERSFLYN